MILAPPEMHVAVRRLGSERTSTTGPDGRRSRANRVIECQVMQQRRPFPPVRRIVEPEPEPPPTRLAILRQRIDRLRTRFHDALLVGVTVLLAFTAIAMFDSTKPPPQHLTQRDINAAVAVAMASATPAPSWASQAYQVIRPSVVQVRAQPEANGASGQQSVGSGVVVTQSGAILTSLHVVQNAAQVKVVFADGSESVAKVVTKQPENDLAVLQPDVIPDDLTPATLSGSPAVGDEVFAVGSPFGISGSITEGVVSGLGRQYKSPTTGQALNNLIQFDAAVNPGNSGGPLVDRSGEVVGIVTGLVNPTGQEVFIGIGLAVPIETAGGAIGTSPF